MATSFVNTMRALRGERSRGAMIAGVAIGVLGLGWIVWMTVAQVPVYRTSVRAHLEVLPAPSRVAVPRGGRVTTARLVVGATVAAGEVLIEVDAEAERLALARAQGQLAALAPELPSLERELAAETDAMLAEGTAGRSSVREQIAKQRAADTELAAAEHELARLIGLQQSGAVAAGDVDAARAELAEKRAARDALGHAADTLVAAEDARAAGRRARTAELERQRAVLEGNVAAARAEVARLELAIEQRTVRAPVAGVLGAVAELSPGAVVADGQEIATVVPDGDALQIVADYGPTAIGRLAPGQAAQLRLDGFPWTRFGTVGARVMRVASEVRDGVIRVELAIDRGPPGIPLTHGMTGMVDVEVERVNPASLVVRSLVDRSSDP
jgi:multidrug resistance efflux pump